MQKKTQVQDTEEQSFAQVIDRLQSARARDRKIRLCRSGLIGVATGGMAFALSAVTAPDMAVTWGLAATAIGALVSGALLWRNAPTMIDFARRADRIAASDAAIETAVEGWAKQTPLNDVTRLLQARVVTATGKVPVTSLAPAHLGRPVAAAVLGIALALVSQMVHRPADPEITRPALHDSLETLASLRDSDDTAVATLAQEAEALMTSLAQGADPADVATALAQLQSQAAEALADTDLNAADLAAVEDALQQMTARATGGDGAPPPEDAMTYADEGPGWGDMDDVQSQNIDAPQNDMVTMATRSEEDAIEDNTLECEFGDEPTCSVRADGELPPMQNQYDEDIPEQMGRDELTQGGDPGQSRSGTGDAGATGTTEAALGGTAEQAAPLEAAFSADTLTLSAANPISEGRRSQGDMTTTFEGGPVTHFPDAPDVGQAAWQRVAEEPVARAPLDPALTQVLRNYYPAPEDWR